MAGCGSGAKKDKKKKGPGAQVTQPQEAKEPIEGVELLWQPEIIKWYLSILAEASNPETLEGAAGAVHNLTACGWRVCGSLGFTNLLYIIFVLFYLPPPPRPCVTLLE